MLLIPVTVISMQRTMEIRFSHVSVLRYRYPAVEDYIDKLRVTINFFYILFLLVFFMEVMSGLEVGKG